MILLPFQIMIAIILDALLGDPPRWPHPVRYIALIALFLERKTRSSFRNEKVAGIVTAVLTLVSVVVVTLTLLILVKHLPPLVGDVVSILVIYTGIARQDLAKHARAVKQALSSTNMAQSRYLVSLICGRDTADLDAEGIIRATVESVAENTVDGITAPIFYAFLGGPLGIMAYKSISTLDSLFGYKNERYRNFGWLSARLDDLAAYVPSRLTGLIVPIAALIQGVSALDSFRIYRRDRLRHASPNSGHTESAFAGALGLRLGGPCSYEGILKDKPFIGDSTRLPTPHSIELSVRLMTTTTLLFFVMLAILWSLGVFVLGFCTRCGVVSSMVGV